MDHAGIDVLTVSQSGTRIGWIDVAKGIAILLVIIGHTLTSGGEPWRAIFSFHMPLFFILAGYTFKVKEWGRLAPSSAKRLLLPYVLMFLLLTVRSNAELFLEPSRLVESLVYALAYQPKQLSWTVDIPYVGAIWFLLCMFMTRLYLNAALRFFGHYHVREAVRLAVMGIFAYIGVLIGRRFLMPFTLDIAFVGAFFMYLGWEFREHGLAMSLRGWKSAALAICLWALAFAWSGLEMGARDYTAFPLAVVCACAGSFVCVKAAMLVDSTAQEGVGLMVPVRRYLTFMGRESMAVFCVHCFEYGVIDWRKLPFLWGVPGEGLVAGIVRVAFVSLVILLMDVL